MGNRQLEILQDFTGGLNTDKTNRLTNNNELKEALNAEYSERGGVQKRKPFNVYHSFSTTRTVEWLFEWNMSGGNSELMAVLDNGDIIKVSDGTTVFNSSFVSSGFGYEVLQEYLYIVDGNEYYRVDDSVFNQEVVQAKDTSYYEYFAEEIKEIQLSTLYDLEFQGLKENSEVVQDSYGDEGTYTKGTHYTIDYQNGTITPLDIATVWATSTSYSVDDYVTNDNIAYICISTHTSSKTDEPGVGDNWETYWDKTVIIDEGQNIFIEYEYFVESDVDLSNVRKCTMMELHNKSNRFFASGNPDDPSAIYYSELLEPNNFKGYSVLYPATNDGVVQGMTTLNDMLLVFYPNSVWAWRGIDPQRDAVWEKLPLQQGTYNGNSIQLTQNTLTFVGLDGIYSLNSLKDAKNITDNKVGNVIKSIANKNDIKAIYESSESKYILAYSETSGTSDKLLVGDWNLGAYAIWEFSEINDLSYTLDGGLYVASGNDILEYGGAYNSDITLRVKTKEILVASPYSDKLITRVYISLSNYTSSTTLKVILDDGETMTFDVTTLTQRFDIQKNSVSIQFELKDTSSENIVLYDFGIEYKVVRTYREDKR